MAVAIIEMVQGEMLMNPDISHFMFGLKRLEMFRITTYYFNVGMHHSSRSMAIRMLELIIHMRMMEVVAKFETKQVEGTACELIPLGSLMGIDPQMALQQQQLSNQDPVLMFPPKMSQGQKCMLPKTFQSLVTKKDGERMEGPVRKSAQAEEWFMKQPIVITVTMDKQHVASLPRSAESLTAPGLLQ